MQIFNQSQVFEQQDIQTYVNQQQTEKMEYYCQETDHIEEHDAITDDNGIAGVASDGPDLNSFLFSAALIPDRFAERMTIIEENQAKIANVTELLPQINAKLEMLGQTRETNRTDVEARAKPIPSEPVNSEAELIALDEKAKLPEFITEVDDAMKTAYSKNTRLNGGWDVALKIILINLALGSFSTQHH